ncbi:GNAT family N-acetyltransferase [Vagococcus carniphilus]|uniref:GNAT family N-acetyltransferase n=1 Tax=Vagococcus carniphilus TaxID=218144 RepID=UPI00288D6099|nr:GNAT family N-acetyltransferase [Vagococcus carniphilus]MDT2815007.1 GNAT family N-acetyltransferase [Vagococcus carniphilus]MDT2864983.1 GNAT family N-acetyltransferase [Vagococcus carniphilus]
MDKKELKNSLYLKKVELKHLKQFNELLRYVFQVTDSDIEEGGYEDESEIIRAKRPVLREADVYGFFTHEDRLISQLAIYPCEVNIHDTVYKMAGVTGVGTYPEYTNFGLMSDLISLGLEKMRDNEQWISYLYPYSIPYYRRKGWEIMSDKIAFEIKDSQLPKRVDVPGYVEREDINHEDVFVVYDQFAEQNHGAMIRQDLNWEEYWRWENEEERTAAIYYNREGEPQGVCFYWIAEEVFHIKEMFYLNQEARHGLWNFVSAHFSMVDLVQGETFKNEPIAFLFEDSEIKETIEPYFMARIVDVEKFIESYPFITTGKPFHFVVEDPIANWNNRTFGLIWDENDDLTITEEAIGNPVYIDIQTLAALFLSYKRPAYLSRIERLKTDKETLRTLERIIPDQAAYFSDYF